MQLKYYPQHSEIRRIFPNGATMQLPLPFLIELARESTGLEPETDPDRI
jgi:hypothetical protein